MSKTTGEEMIRLWEENSTKKIFVDISIEEFQELVKKNTPMKPRHISLLTNPPKYRTICNNCYGFHLERAFKFCPSCGQRIDWSEDDEKYKCF